jgi:hypothetical protein
VNPGGGDADRDVAVKLLPPGRLEDETARSRFRKEARALSRLSHPHVATLHDFGAADGVDYLVMELATPTETAAGTVVGSPPFARDRGFRAGGRDAELVEDTTKAQLSASTASGPSRYTSFFKERGFRTK